MGKDLKDGEKDDEIGVLGPQEKNRQHISKRLRE